MLKFFKLIILALPVFTTACAGSAYKLPKVSSEEIAVVEKELETDKSELKVYSRSDANYEKRLSKISKRLKNSAKPLCETANYNSCYFEIVYDNSEIVNAYAHENYKITIYKGLLQYLKNDDEMAAVVAHEMGHHLAEHNQETQQNAATGAAISGLLTAVLIGAAQQNNPYYSSYQQQQDQELLQNMMVAGANIGAISYSKEQEREADLLGAYLLEHAGYDLDKAQNLMYVFSRISGDPVMGQGAAKAALLSTHPPSTERLVAWSKTIDEIKSSETKLPIPKAQN